MAIVSQGFVGDQWLVKRIAKVSGRELPRWRLSVVGGAKLVRTCADFERRRSRARGEEEGRREGLVPGADGDRLSRSRSGLSRKLWKWCFRQDVAEVAWAQTRHAAGGLASVVESSVSHMHWPAGGDRASSQAHLVSNLEEAAGRRPLSEDR